MARRPQERASKAQGVAASGGGEMFTHPARLVCIVLLVLGFAACVSDQTVTLRYEPVPGLQRLPGAQAVTVFRFADRRGDEGERHSQRVGGIYGGVLDPGRRFA